VYNEAHKKMILDYLFARELSAINTVVV